MRGWTRAIGLLLALVLPSWAGGSAIQGRSFLTWRREGGGFEADPGATDAPLAVGSLQKPFVAKAWAAAHPGEAPPTLLCEGMGACWFHAGHGELGLARALEVSCNAYFRLLARATPAPTLAATLAGEGFLGPGPDLASVLTPDLALGLGGEGASLLIRPSRLLEAYARLVRTPWAFGEPVRLEVLAGLREAALGGTASALGQRGYWAKTGTVPGASLRTRGLALAVDDSGWAVLARLDPGTGRGAAEALAGPLAKMRPWALAFAPAKAGRRVSPEASRRSETADEGPDEVRVGLFDLLRARRIQVRNLGTEPLAAGGGFLGPGASMDLREGEALGPGLLEVRVPDRGLRRRLLGRLVCEEGGAGALRLRAFLTRREYVGGVVAAELGGARGARRLALGAAVLRFLARGPRHPDVDVCDSTHCAWFVGRGPILDWSAPRRARATSEAWAGRFGNGEWAAILREAGHPGPCQWTSHCGGRPLPPRALWGQGESEAPPCLRHDASRARPWVREWRAAEVERAFGEPVRELEATLDEGVWRLRVRGERGLRDLSYDEAHRLLAAVLGWGALPSPADRVEPIPGGFRARGVGLGHRVGLCLGE